MSKWARMISGVVIEVTTIDPAGRFEPHIVWVEVPDEAVPHSTLTGENWSHPEILEVISSNETTELSRTISAEDVRNGLTLAERVKWDNDQAPEIKTVKIEMETPREETDTKDLLELLVFSNLISQQSMDKIIEVPAPEPIAVEPVKEQPVVTNNNVPSEEPGQQL